MLEIKCQWQYKSNVTSGLHLPEGKHIFFLHKIIRIPIRKKKKRGQTVKSKVDCCAYPVTFNLKKGSIFQK